MSAAPPTSVLSVRRLSKTFGGRVVLREVDLDILPGEIHGLVGQNGSGKSTLIKILAGYYTPDPGGSLTVAGAPIPLPLAPRHSDAIGLSFVHQDLGLAGPMTVLENLRIGHYETGLLWRLRWRRERRTVLAMLRRFGAEHISPDALVHSLPALDRAVVAIVRALERIRGHQRGVLVLDEPTVYLPRDGVDRLFATLRRVSQEGFGVLLVTHRLEEVRAVTDRVTILRDGARVDTARTSDLTERDLLERILGRGLGELYPSAHAVQRDVLMSVDLRSGDGVTDLRLELKRGEVVGLTGLLGMGHDRIPYLLFGAGEATGGTITLAGHTYGLPSFSPRRAVAAGLALLPADRLQSGGAQAATVLENVSLPTISHYFRRGLLRHQLERRQVAGFLSAFQVAPPEPDKVFGELSGGNQQKALIAKWFQVDPKVLLLHEPTQGVDVGARKQIFARIRDFAEAGGAILISSVEYEDLAHLCDRVIVFRHGHAVSELAKPHISESMIVEQCYNAGLKSA